MQRRNWLVSGRNPWATAFSPDHLAGAASGRAAPVKSLLLDQRVVAGLGNIYVCEALWRAGIAPIREAAHSERGEKSLPLSPPIREVLADAIAAGGSTLKDFVSRPRAPPAISSTVSMFMAAPVKPCRRPGCGGTVVRIVQSGRSSFYCPDCQRK